MRRVVLAVVVAVSAITAVGVAVWDGSLAVNVTTSDPVERIDPWVIGDAVRSVDLDRAIERESEKAEREEAESEPDPEPTAGTESEPTPEPAPAPEPAGVPPVPGESTEEYRERFEDYRERVPEDIPENPGE